MHRAVPRLLGLLLLAPLAARAQGFAELHANYDMYAAGFNVVQLDVGFATAPHPTACSWPFTQPASSACSCTAISAARSMAVGTKAGLTRASMKAPASGMARIA